MAHKFVRHTERTFFENVYSGNIIAFIKDINFYHHNIVVILYWLYRLHFSNHFTIPD